MKTLYTLILVLSAGSLAVAQQHRLDVNIRANVLTYAGEPHYGRDWTGPAIGPSLEVLYFPVSFVGVGGYYSRSVMSGGFDYENYVNDFYWWDSPMVATKYDFNMYGASLQFTTNRKRGFRAYVVGRAGKMEILEDFERYTIGNTGTTFGGGIGIMVKLGRMVSFNIFEANYMFLPEEFSIHNADALQGFYAQSGLVVKAWRKK
jgi:hypothetical protein